MHELGAGLEVEVKVKSAWYSPRVQQEINVARWGHFGQPVLLFPTAGGDCEEAERFLMMKALAPLLDSGRIKVYACDSVSGRAWVDGDLQPHQKAEAQNRFDAFIYHELVPAIRQDCNSTGIEIVAAGASIGAFNALASVCRHPDAFKSAICMSGTYDLTRWMNGFHNADFHVASPLHFLPMLQDGPQLRALQQRFIYLGTGQGRYEAPEESWVVGNALGARGIPNRVDMWGHDFHHDWVTWRHKLPQYLDTLTTN